MAASPTARSLDYLRKEGWWAYPVEKFNSFTKRRTDVAGFGDILAWSPDTCETALVQVTSTPNLASRRTKILVECNAAAQAWIEAGLGHLPGVHYNIIILHGWAKRGARGARKLWTVSEDLVTREELQEYEEEAKKFERKKAREAAKKKAARKKKRGKR